MPDYYIRLPLLESGKCNPLCELDIFRLCRILSSNCGDVSVSACERGGYHIKTKEQIPPEDLKILINGLQKQCLEIEVVG